ncbi:glycosyltransferase family 4 protein [Longibaculum muris]|uniref:Glycosyltransferase involved in cell wall biosynthesis n=1 Tax=Longibaculum muris TaxID=1796628 RepID=A0A4R3Z991_9FIRM|nr:glycosyltransferase family 4 protein [Longibaculum muris]MBS5369634.1 glycosyltransferase family 4 protein [Coprobacillus cateniformis]MCR1888168.1 glycosyltransferase family 4 protein [Longibaculum muris]TCW01033.1 glycosyltransferase involved in cell wall biosynthesis [Longibaculum muris]
MKKKVVWIVNEYNFPNAIKSRQTNLCRQLTLSGYDAYIVSGSVENKSGRNVLFKNEKFRFVETDEAKGYLINTSSYRRNFERVLVALQFQRRLWNLRNELPMPDVIVSDFAGLFGNIFLKWKKKYGTKVIYDILDLWPEGFVDMGYLKKNSLIAKVLYGMEHKSYREADGIIFSFQGGRDYIIDKGWSKETGGDVDTSDIGYLNNGVDLESVDEQKDKWILDDPDLDTDKFKVVYLGSISAFNGLDVLVETARELQERKVQDVLFLVYGCGNQEEQLKNMAKDYDLNNIKFKGPLDKKYAMNLLSRSNLNLFTFVNTPLLKYGVSPNKLFMYFASGKPVLSMIKPMYDLVQEKKCGISVENDSKIVADAVMKFRTMKNEQYQMYCENARKTAIEYDYKNLVNCLIEKIEK